MSVWISRPGPAGERTVHVLRGAGIDAIAAPMLSIRLTLPDPVPFGDPDAAVLVSGNAVRGLAAACECNSVPVVDPHRILVAAVGRRTAEVAEAAGWPVHVVASPESAEGLIRALQDRSWAGKGVWIPTGDREGTARRVLGPWFESMGARTALFRVYVNGPRRLTPEESARLDAAEPEALVVHSPSAADELFSPEAPETVRRWASRAAVISIGPTTTARLHELGVDSRECSEPSDNGILSALRAGGWAGAEPRRRP